MRKSLLSVFQLSIALLVTIVLKKTFQKDGIDRKALQKEILDSPCEELFDFKEPSFELPEKARLFQSYRCERCGENAPEPVIRLVEGQKVCLDCYPAYSRGWQA
ncbi:MAG: hypothetical protein EHM79_02415 [Geobacter sp.]|nr:MAG: hypothetical protein EHM79_02415 [Geobacter sp.]